MADPYESYRFNQNAGQDPWALGAGPQQFGGESESLWGHIRKPIGAGMMFGPTGAAAVNSVQAFGGLNEIKNGQFFKNIVSPDNWKDFATFGMGSSRRKNDEARAARRGAVAQWRQSQGSRLGELLGQSGSDVRGDLEGELTQALGAGGDMGDENQIRDAMTQFQQRYQQYMLGRSRAGQARQVDAMMSDPRRLSDRNGRLQAERAQGMGDIAESYRIGQRDNAFNQARRGTQGGSMDVEKQGELGRGRDKAASGLQAGLEDKARSYRLGDQQQRSALMGMIYADDPSTAAAFSRTLEGIGDQGQLVQENQAIGRQRSAARAASATGYSQAVGGAMSAASRPLEYHLSNQGGGA